MASLGQAIVKRLSSYMGRNPTPRPLPYKEMGTSGTAVYGGYVQVKERSPEWIGRQKWVTASELSINTSIVAASLHYFLNLVASPNWTFRPHDEEDEESLALAEFAENVLNDMDTPWYKVVRRAAMYRFHGFAIQEWTAKHRDDGLIGFKDIESRPQHTIEQWDVDEDGTVLGVWQRSPQTGALLGIPRDKVMYLVEDTLTDSPEGIGVFRHMADPYNRLRQLQQLEIRAYERDMRGTPIARAPLTFIDRAIKQNVITAADAQRLVSEFQELVKLQVKQSDTGVVLDSLPYFSDSDAGDQVSAVPQWSFELLQGGGVGHAEIAQAIDRIQRELARMVGTEHLMMGDQGGNRALSEDKSRNLYLIGNSVLKYVAAVVKSDILVPVWKLNGFPMRKLPEPKPEDVTFKNAEAITNALGKMASAGAVLSPTDPVINDVRDLLGVERVPDDIMAQGAMPNPALAGLPPHLQNGMLGGKGGPINVKTGGLPGKPGMGGGGPFGKPGLGSGGPPNVSKAQPPFLVDDDDHDDEIPVDEAGNPIEEPTDPAAGGAGGTGTTEIDVNGPKPGGKIEVSTDLLVRVLERLTGGHDAGALQLKQDDPSTQQKDPRALGQDVEAKPKSEAEAHAARLGEPQSDPRAAPQGREAARLDPRQVAEPRKPVAGDSSPSGAKKPMAAKPVDDPKAVASSTEPKAQAKEELGAGDPAGAAGAKPKPAAGKPGESKPGVPGTQPSAVPGQPGDPVAAVGAVPGVGLPQSLPKPEMTPELASEVLQPYADHSVAPEEVNPQNESDVLWSRLGDEKDAAKPTIGDGDPVIDDLARVVVGGEEDAVLEPEETADGGDSGQRGARMLSPDQTDDQEVAEVDGEAATRARLRALLDRPSDPSVEAEVTDEPMEDPLMAKPKPKLKPKPKPKPRKRLRL